MTRYGIDPLPDHLPTLAAAWQCDLATDELRWAGGVFDLFGIPRGTRVDRRSTLEQYLPESRALLERLRGEALATCGSFTFEAQIVRPTGERRWMRLSADVQKIGGRAAFLYGTKRDITEEIVGEIAPCRYSPVTPGLTRGPASFAV